MPAVDVDFETYKQIVARRRDESMSEGDVIREALGMSGPSKANSSNNPAQTWWYKGVELPIGMQLEHTFRDGKTACAVVVDGGLEYAGKVYRSLSPAGVAAAGYQVDGWAFWNYRDERGNWLPVKTKRNS